MNHVTLKTTSSITGIESSRLYIYDENTSCPLCGTSPATEKINFKLTTLKTVADLPCCLECKQKYQSELLRIVVVAVIFFIVFFASAALAKHIDLFAKIGIAMPLIGLFLLYQFFVARPASSRRRVNKWLKQHTQS